jgi:MerR family transcriptional regulator, heat shock protein HspR
MAYGRPERDPERPVYVISVAATLVSAHPRTLRIYEDEGLLCPARTPTNIRLYSENDIRRLTWIRHLTRERGVNLAGVRILFELEERLGARILEALYAEGTGDAESTGKARRATTGDAESVPSTEPTTPPVPSPASADDPTGSTTHPSADRTPASSTVGET